MTTNDGSNQAPIWPMPKFRFEVDFGTDQKGVPFQEVSGLDDETQVIDYKIGKSAIFTPVKMPGISKCGNVTLKKGVFVNDNTFWKWQDEIKMNTIKRRTVVISLLDESGNVSMQWQLKNAWPTKITSTEVKLDGNAVVIDSIEIVYEKIVITYGK